MPSSVHNLLKSELNRLPEIKRIWIAYSGGVDSHVLLHALRQLQPDYKFGIRAIHVNHGLNGKAGAWEIHCSKVCDLLGIECHALNVEVKPQPKKSLEETARIARYNAFKACIQTGDYLATGHHADDQAETFLLHLLKGSGTRGLAGMPRLSSLATGFLWRPLLSLPQDILIKYAILHQLEWIEDDSNADVRFDRNYLRHQVLPTLKKRWPHTIDAISQSTQRCEAAELVVQELTREDLASVEACANSLNLSKLQSLSLTRRHNVLRYWLKQQGLPLPRRVHLDQFENYFMPARQDAAPKLSWSTVQLRRYLNKLYVLPHAYTESIIDTFTWKLNEPMVLPFDLGKLIVQQKRGRGIKEEIIHSAHRIEVRFRQGGESISLLGDTHTRVLKKWLQHLKIPPWERGRIPLIYINGELAQVLINSNQAICKKFAADADEEGYLIKIINSPYANTGNL